MFSLHSPSCKGPPLGCNRGYWYICTILLIASSLEGIIARFAAHSQSAQADAIHMGLHGVFYGSFVYINIVAKIRKLYPHDEMKLRLRYARINILFLFVFLSYIVFGETLPKFWKPAHVTGVWMLVGVVGGILGTLITLLVLQKMKRDHGFNVQSKNCDGGRRLFHKVFVIDALGDLIISLAVFIAAVLIIIDQGLSWLDPPITLIAAIIIIRQAVLLLKSLKENELHHLHNH